MAVETFERFLNPADRANAVAELSEKGGEAVSLLLSLFEGTAKNDFGSPYKDIGASECGFEVAVRLGPRAKPLERHLRDGSRARYPTAVAALGNLERLDQPSVDTLVEAVRSGRAAVQAEAAAALLKQGLGEHPCLAELERSSDAWLSFLTRLRAQYAPHPGLRPNVR